MERGAYLNRKAQALTELAVFGSILLVLLGVLLNYGLRYNYQQQVEQIALKKAMVAADQANLQKTPSAVQYLIIKDVHIPDFSQPFAIGSLSTVGGSAAVRRSYADNFPNATSELPVVRVEINDVVYDYALADIYRPKMVNYLQEKKYNVIYGRGSVDEESNTTVNSFSMDHRRDCFWTVNSSDPIYMHQHCNYNASKRYNLTVLDYCAGEIMDYYSALERCRQILDRDKCKVVCYDDNPNEDCEAVCAASIEIPWYCEANRATPPYSASNFVKLNRLFNMGSGQAEPASMGLQSDYYDDLTTSNLLNKEETRADITTKDTFSWSSTRTREIVYRKLGDTSGNPTTDQNVTKVYQNKTTTWTTPKLGTRRQN